MLCVVGGLQESWHESDLEYAEVGGGFLVRCPGSLQAGVALGQNSAVADVVGFEGVPAEQAGYLLAVEAGVAAKLAQPLAEGLALALEVAHR